MDIVRAADNCAASAATDLVMLTMIVVIKMMIITL